MHVQHAVRRVNVSANTRQTFNPLRRSDRIWSGYTRHVNTVGAFVSYTIATRSSSSENAKRILSIGTLHLRHSKTRCTAHRLFATEYFQHGCAPSPISFSSGLRFPRCDRARVWVLRPIVCFSASVFRVYNHSEAPGYLNEEGKSQRRLRTCPRTVYRSPHTDPQWRRDASLPPSSFHPIEYMRARRRFSTDPRRLNGAEEISLGLGGRFASGRANCPRSDPLIHNVAPSVSRPPAPSRGVPPFRQKSSRARFHAHDSRGKEEDNSRPCVAFTPGERCCARSAGVRKSLKGLAPSVRYVHGVPRDSAVYLLEPPTDWLARWVIWDSFLRTRPRGSHTFDVAKSRLQKDRENTLALDLRIPTLSLSPCTDKSLLRECDVKHGRRRSRRERRSRARESDRKFARR